MKNEYEKPNYSYTILFAMIPTLLIVSFIREMDSNYPPYHLLVLASLFILVIIYWLVSEFFEIREFKMVIKHGELINGTVIDSVLELKPTKTNKEGLRKLIVAYYEDGERHTFLTPYSVIKPIKGVTTCDVYRWKGKLVACNFRNNY